MRSRARQKGGRGLLLSIPGKRPRRLMDIAGNLTDAGTYYYEKAAREAPTHGFDARQEPTRRGARVHIKMLDGTTAAVKTWDNINGQWKFTKLGKHFYKDSTDTYLVTFPVHSTLLRNNGSEWKVDTVLT